MTKNISDTKMMKLLISRNCESSNYYVANILLVEEISSNLLSRLPGIFHNYTKHDISHSINIIEIMAELVDLEDFSSLELTIMIMAALTHDLGMFASDDEIDDIKRGNLIVSGRKYEKVLKYLDNEQVALEECIRPGHAKRSKVIIEKNILSENSKVFNAFKSESSYFDELSLINESHNESLQWVKTNLRKECTIGIEEYSGQFVSILLRLADLLDVDDRRTPLVLRENLNLPAKSIEEWNKHTVITNHKKVSIKKDSVYRTIFFDGNANDPVVYRDILKYLDYFQEELVKSIIYSNKEFTDKKYNLRIEKEIDNRIKTSGFEFADFKLKLNYEPVTELLMGENIYGSKEYGIRELIQNSLDACNVYKSQNQHVEELNINIIWDDENNSLVIRDNGVGMTPEILQKYFLNIGSSYYKSPDFIYQGLNFHAIGNYGIGFLACFMLSSKVSVTTKGAHEDFQIQIKLEKGSEYIEYSIEKAEMIHGTIISLELDEVKKVFPTKEKIEEFIIDNFLSCEFPICINYKELELKSLDKLAQSLDWADLSNYLNGLTLLSKFSINNIKTNKYLESLEKTSYIARIINNEKITISLTTSEDLVSEIIVDGKLSYVDIPHIETDDMYQAIQYSDDFESALNRIDYTMLRVYYNSNDIEIVNTELDQEDDLFVSLNSQEVLNITLSELFEQLQLEQYYTEILEVSSDELDFVNSGSEYLQYSDVHLYFNSLFNTYISKSTKSLYVNNIKIKSFQFRIGSMIKNVDIEDIIVNSKEGVIIPTLSRNSINQSVAKELNSAISCSILLYIRDISSDLLVKTCIQKLIDSNYNVENQFLNVDKLPLVL